MAHHQAKVVGVDRKPICSHVDCNKVPMVGSDFCSGQCAAKTVDQYDEIAGDLYHFPGANISPEYCEGFRVNVPRK